MPNGWTVDAVADTITFLEAPAAGTNNIVVNEIPTANFNSTDVWAVGAWCTAYGFPSEVEFYADRLIFAATLSQPQNLWMSRIGDYSMFGRSTPILDDDPITSTFNARQLNQIVEIVALESMIVLTSGGEWRAQGGEGDVLTPSTTGFRPQTKVGASPLPALTVEESAIFTQAKGYSVRGLTYTFEKDGYSDTDLTAFASHLVENRQIIDWCYQAVPYSAIYAVRDDGMVLSMTYKREHRVVAWTRLPFGDDASPAECLSSCSIPEESSNAVYFAVRRWVNGAWRQFIERAGDQVDDVRDWIGSDCSLVFDGRNTAATTITLASANWEPEFPVTITASAALFSNPSSLGDAIVLDYDGEPLPIEIFEYVSPTVVRGYPERLVPVGLRAPGVSWALARDTFSGLSHLEGAQVRIGSDGFDMDRQTVVGGQITLDQPGVVVCVGLPFVADFESLDFTLIGGEAVGGRTKLCRTIDLLLKGTRTIKAGTTFDALEELKARDSESLYLPPAEKTEVATLDVHGEWQKSPRVCIRHDSAYPACVLSMTPHVEITPR
jgi:hypothetical protein